MFHEIPKKTFLHFTRNNDTITKIYNFKGLGGFSVKTGTIILLVILAVMIILLVGLYFLGKKAQKKQEAQQGQLEAAAQTVSMLIIDKKRMRLKDAGLPQIVIDQTPKLLRRSKLPIVKAKVGPKVMSLICDEKIFDSVPVKKEVKAVVSGIYITSVKGLRGPLEQPKKKKGFRAKVQDKANQMQSKLKEETKESKKSKKK